MILTNNDPEPFLRMIEEGLSGLRTCSPAPEPLGDYVRMSSAQMQEIGRTADAIRALREAVPPRESGTLLTDADVVNYAARQLASAYKLITDASVELLSARAEAESAQEELKHLRHDRLKDASPPASAANPADALLEAMRSNPDLNKSLEELMLRIQQMFRRD